MHTVLPIMIIIALGALAAVVLRRLRTPFLVRSAAAALLATAVWVCGTGLLMWITAPNELLGPPLPAPVFKAFLTTLAPALLVGWLIRSKQADARRDATSL